jgi:hypothetical protein
MTSKKNKTIERVRPPLLNKVSRFEETKIIHKRSLELNDVEQSQNGMPRVPLHSSINSRCDEYLIALSEYRQGLVHAVSHRSTGDVNIHELPNCFNSY